jgi:Flp pilus assembly protein TadD
MKRIAWKFAASTAVLGATTIGFVTNGVGIAPASAFESEGRAQSQAAQLFERASRAIAENKLAEAIPLLEQALTISPRDAGYRLLLADAYMRSGRFKSAEATYRDVLSIDPGRPRAALALALMQVANGRQQEAMNQLEQLEGTAAPADLGLAYALAGAPQRAVDLLEPAARATSASPRTRQNLALAYALGGDWQSARTIAAQDVSPA